MYTKSVRYFPYKLCTYPRALLCLHLILAAPIIWQYTPSLAGYAPIQIDRILLSMINAKSAPTLVPFSACTSTCSPSIWQYTPLRAGWASNSCEGMHAKAAQKSLQIMSKLCQKIGVHWNSAT